MNYLTKDYKFKEAIRQYDHSGKPIETNFNVVATTTEEVERIVNFAIRQRFGVMAIGAKTSGLGSFEVFEQMQMHNLEGVVGIEFRKPDASLPRPYEIKMLDGGDDNLIRNPEGTIAIKKAKNFPHDSHEVVAHGAETITNVNNFLEKELGRENFCFRLMADPTSRRCATLGGVIVTGAQGENRTSVAADLTGLKMVDGNGDIRILEGADARKIVGLNGVTGMVTEARFRVAAFPKHKYGVVVPIKGCGVDAWKNSLELQIRLEEYCTVGPEFAFGLLKSPYFENNPCFVNGIELFSGRELREVLHQLDDVELRMKIAEKTLNNELTVFITAYTDDQKITVMNELNEYDAILLDEPECDAIELLRDAIPRAARKEAVELGGISKSTDFNLRIRKSKTRHKAVNTVAKIYAEYAEKYSNENFRVGIYGHLHPGMGIGGGIDPHVRATYALKDKLNPEKQQEMEKNVEKLYMDLLRLDGQDGIEVKRPEKSCFMNRTYWKWLELKRPEKARRIKEVILELGCAKNNLATFAFRGPISHEQFIGNLKMKYCDWNAILNLSQISHRSTELKMAFADAIRECGNRWQFKDNQYLFFCESLAEAKRIILRNFPGDSGKKILSDTLVVKPKNPTQLRSIKIEQKGMTFIDLDKIMHLKGLCCMIVPHELICRSYEINDQMPVGFRSLHKMWLQYPYETEETPPTLQIMLLRAYMNNIMVENNDNAFWLANHGENKLMSLNPGPTKCAETVFEKQNLILGTTSRKDIDEAKRLIKYYLNCSKESSVHFAGSATHMMQRIADKTQENPGKYNIIQIVNGAFAQRFNKILHWTGANIETLRIPWLRGTNTDIDNVAEFVVTNIDREKNNILMLTPHETSTTVSSDPELLLQRLRMNDLRPGKEFELICDVTSSAGAYGYKANNFSLMMSVQKGLACPPGMGIAAMTPGLDKWLKLNDGIENLRSLNLKITSNVIKEFIAKNQNGEVIQRECRIKKKLITDFVAVEPELEILPVCEDDQSDILVGVYSNVYDLREVQRVMDKYFGIKVGSGYGPMRKNSLRLYLPSANLAEIKSMLIAFKAALKLIHTN